VHITAKSVLPAAAEELSMAPSQNALLSTSPADSYSPVYYPEALIAQGWLSPSPAATDLIFSSMITSITSGQYQSKDALDAADQALTAALPSSN
jgi:hypothetical protein